MQLVVRPTRRAVIVLVALSLLSIGSLGASGAAPTVQVPAIVDPGLLGRGGTLPIVVRETSATDRTAEDTVRRLGGTVARDLPIIDGFSGTLPAGALDELARVASVRAISLNRPIRFLGTGGTISRDAAYQATVRADDVWDAGYQGAGSTIAIIDTGIADVPNLSGQVKSVYDDVTGTPSKCVNLTSESNCGDSYGHGTFVAGIAVGKGALKGVAPQAKALSVKIAGRDGAADVSTVLAALQWVVSHRAQYGIGVLNLSLGTDSPQSYRIDPLNYGVEKAWSAGIVVVVAAGNLGPDYATVTKPGDDPWVVTVGAIDDEGTEATDDDTIPDFSGRGPTLADALPKPDLVAPGAHMVSLRSPGSYVEENFGATADGHYRKGSGTSFAAPVVAGTVALMRERNPSMTPNQIKYALMNSTAPANSADPFEVGSGLVDAYVATMSPPQGSANQGLLPSDGSGSLDASRGSLRFAADDPAATAISGNLTQQLLFFDSLAYRTVGWTPLSWLQAQWVGAKWHGAKWHDIAWTGAKWHGAKWHGAKWHGAKWHEADGEEDRYGTGLLGNAIYGAWE